MDKVTIVERLQEIYENIEHLLGSDEWYEIEDLIEEIEQDIVHGDKDKTIQVGEDEEG